LASNSLLEALVFGARAADDIKAHVATGNARGTPPAPSRFQAVAPPQALRDALTRHVGLERDCAGLQKALSAIGAIERAANGEPSLLNMTAAAKLVAAAALRREESRGGHFRSDYPQTSDEIARTFMSFADANRIALGDAPAPSRAAR
jgi:L-aspartate oxidase